MARGRMVSKDISVDEKVNALSDDTARLLWTWLIPHLDVEGRMYGDAQLFKSIVAPRRNYTITRVEKYLCELENKGLIIRYFCDVFVKKEGDTFEKTALGVKIRGSVFQRTGTSVEREGQQTQFLFAPNFEKHQIGLRKDKETPSRIPPPPTELRRSKDGVRTELRPPKRREIKEKRNIIEKSKEKKTIFSLPDWIKKDIWDAFLEMRKGKKAIPTNHGLTLLVRELEKLKAAGDDPNEVLNQSIMNNWTGIFPLKREGGVNGVNRGHNQKRLPDREHGYTEPPPDPELDALVAASQGHS